MARAITLSSACSGLLFSLSTAFAPDIAPLFMNLSWAWLLCLGRPTVANLLRALPEPLQRHWTCAHRFFSKTRWSPDELFRLLVCNILDPLLPRDQPWLVAADDTTAHKHGPKVAFAGRFRDAVRSTPRQTVFHHAHNWIVVCLLAPMPFCRGRYLHIPVLARLYKKEKACSPADPFRTRQKLVAEMITLLQSWVPHRRISLVTDGQYPSDELLEQLPDAIPLVSRLRSNAVLNQLPPPRQPRQRGATRKKGARLPRLDQIAKNARFQRRFVWRYGKKELVLVHSFVCLWYRVAKTSPIRVIIVRDLAGRQPDDYFFSTDPNIDAAKAIEHYAARWGIEELNRESKQSLGLEDVQSWSPKAVLRQVPLALILHAVVQVTHLQVRGSMSADPIHSEACNPLPSFQRMLCALRIDKWQQRIFATLPSHKNVKKFFSPIASVLATAS